ncbi:dipeptide epimerase [Haloprofundus marisrubri]|uniref:dipeptide epimerase n=1 Tax=Haloprofundus marisrubri TaxID=1514971 RepID=UPI0009E51EDF|nr:dipeptide epimerase [Haloprofundus marisrubri]
MSLIESVSVLPVDIPLETPFEIALGTQESAQNLFVRIETASGAVGIGEASPLPPVTGASRDAAVEQARAATDLLVGRDIAEYRVLVDEVRQAAPRMVSSSLAIEMALLDAVARERQISLAEIFGARPTPITTDVTLSTVDPDTARERATAAAEAGYYALKVKVGDDLPSSLSRVRAAADAYPDAEITVDANQGWSPAEAVRFCRELRNSGIDLKLLEQPVAASDVTGLAQIRNQVTVPVAADEAVFSPEDALRVIDNNAADVINIKLAKSGLLGAQRIAAIANAANVDLMIGCMLETAVGLHAAAHVVAGIGGFTHIDLDGNDSHTRFFGGPTPSPTFTPSGPGHGIQPDLDW